MIHQGVCPKCDKRVLHVHVESVFGMVEGESKARCLSFCCIHCKAVLGVQIDSRGKKRSKRESEEIAAKAKAAK
jgi:hypothetical protein